MGCIKSCSKRKVYSYKRLHEENRKISNKQPNIVPQRARKKEQTKSQVSRRKEMIKVRAEINEIQDKKTIEKIKKTNS